MSPGLWQHPDFRRLIIAQAISQVGAKLAREALPLTAVLVLGVGPIAMSWLSIAQSLPTLLLALHAGAFLDRLRRRPGMILADFARFLVLATVPVTAFMGWLGMGQLCLVAFVVSAFTLAFDIADQAYLPGLVGRPQILKANAAKEANAAAAEVIGPPLGGLLVQVIGAPLTILIDAVSYLLSALCLLRIKTPEEPPSVPRRLSLRAEIGDGFRVLWHDVVLRPLLVSRFFRAFFGSMIGPFYVLYLVGDLKLSPFMLGIIIAVGGAASLVGAATAPWLAKRMPIGPGLIAAFAMKTLGLACVPLAGLLLGISPALMILFLMLQQLLGDGSTGYFAVVERSLRQHRVPATHLARTGATIRLVNDGPLPIAATLAGFIAESYGLNVMMWIAVIGYAAAPVIAFRSEVWKLRALD